MRYALWLHGVFYDFSAYPMVHNLKNNFSILVAMTANGVNGHPSFTVLLGE